MLTWQSSAYSVLSLALSAAGALLMRRCWGLLRHIRQLRQKAHTPEVDAQDWHSDRQRQGHLPDDGAVSADDDEDAFFPGDRGALLQLNA